ncbi:MAG: hypothetical protein H8E41_12745 [Desulfobulbaceae bacterium]|uniref:Uncharacterized protein n=1 Tax=Candidatus Desulfobia pelagia TaxID=2841692 RepID=A0A8J6NDX0_9BACT|nr:hypothetical protein [Candidatus Desulfobia pelagia]
MKINDLQNAQIAGNSKNITSKVSGGADFQQILEARQNALAEPAKVGSVDQKGSGAMSVELRLESLQLSEKTMSTLESFGSALKNLDFAGEDLEPYVAALEDETRSLQELKKQLPVQDPLTKLLDRVATVSYIEAAKYRRGDYL